METRCSRIERREITSSKKRASLDHFISFFFLVIVSSSLLFQSSNAQFSIIPPPATPTNLNQSFSPGPDLPPPNRTAQPLPPLPAQPIGQTILNYDTESKGLYRSINVGGNYLGVSIELSVVLSILGHQADSLNSPFLNYMSNVGSRAGVGPLIRIGGNTQDTAIYNNSSPKPVVKVSPQTYNPDNGAPVTPDIEFSNVLFDIIEATITALDSQLIFGVNMVQINASFTPQMVSDLSSQIKDRLFALLVGNEPDRYVLTGARQNGYDIPDYLDEWGDLTQRTSNAASDLEDKIYVAPNVCCDWSTDEVIEGNQMLNRFKDRLKAISAIQYPQSLCSSKTIYGHSGYLNQSLINSFASYDSDAVSYSVSNGLPFILAEFNTASCIGVKGVSDSFTSAIWSINSALQMAFRNHSNALLHTSGQSTLYNLFTPPSFDSNYTAWRTGPIFYSLLVVAEALASTGPMESNPSSSVKDLGVESEFNAAYAIYEGEEAQKLVLINMVNDPSGKNDWQVQVPLPDSERGVESVDVKYLLAPAVDEMSNITWANQTFGYYSSGDIQGTEHISQSTCLNETNSCSVSIPAPGVALVFLTSKAKSKASPTIITFQPQGTEDARAVQGSNGSRGTRNGATSEGSAENGAQSRRLAGVGSQVLLLLAASLLMSMVR